MRQSRWTMDPHVSGLAMLTPASPSSFWSSPPSSSSSGKMSTEMTISHCAAPTAPNQWASQLSPGANSPSRANACAAANAVARSTTSRAW